VKVGRLEPIREVLDVRDVVEAYLALLAGGDAGETYNICGGEALSVGDLFQRLAGLVGSNAVPEVDANLTRATDIRHLVGDATKIRAATGWRPRRPLTETLADLVRAQAD